MVPYMNLTVLRLASYLTWRRSILVEYRSSTLSHLKRSMQKLLMVSKLEIHNHQRTILRLNTTVIVPRLWLLITLIIQCTHQTNQSRQYHTRFANQSAQLDLGLNQLLELPWCLMWIVNFTYTMCSCKTDLRVLSTCLLRTSQYLEI